MGDVEPKSDEFSEISSMSLGLLAAFMESPYVSGVNEAYSLDLVRWSVEATRNPDLIRQTVLRVGYGGSDDDEIAMRHPAYLLPALDIWRGVDKVRESRLQAMHHLKVTHIKEAILEQGNLDVRAMTKEEKRALFEDAESKMDQYEFSDEQLEGFAKEARVFEMPRIELLYAYNLGILINHKDEAKTKLQAENSVRLTRQFVDNFFPDAAEHIEIKFDNPKD